VRVRSGLAGLAFVLGHLAPFFLMCDARDLGVHADPQSPLAEGRPSVVLYDQVPAGIGFSQRLFELHDELVRRAYELVASCGATTAVPRAWGLAVRTGWAEARNAGYLGGVITFERWNVITFERCQEFEFCRAYRRT
jgi:DEAD/DEAH box helicase domain-containing protein